MTPEELYIKYEKIVYASFYKLIKYPESFALKKGFELEDLFQYGRLGLWRAALTYTDEDSFPSYAYEVVNGVYKDIIFHMRPYFLIRLPYRNEEEEREGTVSYLSLDKEDEEYGDTFYNMLPSPYNVENYVLRKIELDEKLDSLTEKQASYLVDFLNGYSTTEIAYKNGLKHQYGISLAIRKAMQQFDPDFKMSLRRSRLSEEVG